MEKETSNKRDYIAYAPIKMERITSGKRNYESMGKDPNGNIFDANTIYQTDYTTNPKKQKKAFNPDKAPKLKNNRSSYDTKE